MAKKSPRKTIELITLMSVLGLTIGVSLLSRRVADIASVMQRRCLTDPAPGCMSPKCVTGRWQCLGERNPSNGNAVERNSRPPECPDVPPRCASRSRPRCVNGTWQCPQPTADAGATASVDLLCPGPKPICTTHAFLACFPVPGSAEWSWSCRPLPQDPTT